MRDGRPHPWVVFMGAWIALFIGLNVTGNLFFGAAMGLMACGLTASMFTNWRGIGDAIYQMTRSQSLTYLVFRWTSGFGFLLALVVTGFFLGGAITSTV